MKLHLTRRLLATLAGAVSLACTPGNAASFLEDIDAKPVVTEPDDEDTIPCGPRHVLQSVCQRCHQNPPIRGAPFPLVTRSNIVRVGPDGQIRELMIAQLEARRMPLFPETIDEGSRTILLAWLHAGAPAIEPRECELLPSEGGTDVEDVEADAGPDAPVDAASDQDAPSGDGG
jgi:hypothetical protein